MLVTNAVVVVCLVMSATAVEAKGLAPKQRKKQQPTAVAGSGGTAMTTTTTNDICSQYISCEGCVTTDDNACSWCATYGICLPGLNAGASACPSLYSSTEASCEDSTICSNLDGDCGGCLAVLTGNCGYCTGSGQCLPTGGPSGPLSGGCSFGWRNEWNQCASPGLQQSPLSCTACLNPLGIAPAGPMNLVVWCVNEQTCTPGNSSYGPFDNSCDTFTSSAVECNDSPGDSGCTSRSYTSCSICTEDDRCAWCPESSECLDMTSFQAPSCPNSGLAIQICDCSDHSTSCGCISNSACVWCGTSGACVYSPDFLSPAAIGPLLGGGEVCPGYHFIGARSDGVDCYSSSICNGHNTCQGCVSNNYGTASTGACGWCQPFDDFGGSCMCGSLQGPDNTDGLCLGSWSTTAQQCTNAVSPMDCSVYKTCNGCQNGITGCGWCSTTKFCTPSSDQGYSPADPSACASGWVNPGSC